MTVEHNPRQGFRVRLGAETTPQRVAVMARESAARVEQKDKDDPEALGQWDEFEWGMVNGKLSALRWVLRDVWDFFDT